MLDEVDAALDNANVQAGHLCEESRRTRYAVHRHLIEDRLFPGQRGISGYLQGSISKLEQELDIGFEEVC